jgi:uroporphyrinogen III methyltransferase/synthase
VLPEVFTGEELGQALAGLGSLKGLATLLARADIARPALAEALARAGANVTDLPIYRTVCPRELPAAAVEALQAGRVDWITFTSSSTATNFLGLIEPLAPAGDVHALLRREGRDVWLASIGPITSQTLREHGLSPTVEAASHDVPGLIAAIGQAEQVSADEASPT